MAKAQWKQTPRDRAYGTPRHTDIEKLNMQIADLMARNDVLHQKYAMLMESRDRLREQTTELQSRIALLHQFRAAYLILRSRGVVMQDAEEFKHLQNEDMDAFFGVTSLDGPDTRRKSIAPPTPTKLLAPVNMRDAAYQLIQKEFERAYTQMIDEQWQAPQKRS